MVHKETTLRRDLQTHPQPVLILTPRPHRQVALSEAVKSHKLSNLQKCFDEATWAYKQYRLTEHRRGLEVLEASVEINETSHQHKPNRGGQCSNNYNNYRSNSQGFKNNKSFNGKTAYNYGPKVQFKFCSGPREIFKIYKLLEENANNPEQYAEMKLANSVHDRSGNSAHINEIELEALAEVMEHPIEHVIHEINMFAFSEIEEANESHIWLGELKSCYDPQEYHKDTETNSCVYCIYILYVITHSYCIGRHEDSLYLSS